eukprot:761435-Hanusia_phi.AAC.3
MDEDAGDGTLRSLRPAEGVAPRVGDAEACGTVVSSRLDIRLPLQDPLDSVAILADAERDSLLRAEHGAGGESSRRFDVDCDRVQAVVVLS